MELETEIQSGADIDAAINRLEERLELLVDQVLDIMGRLTKLERQYTKKFPEEPKREANVERLFQALDNAQAAWKAEAAERWRRYHEDI